MPMLTRAAVGLVTVTGLLMGTSVAGAQTAADSANTDVTFTVLGLKGDLEISVALSNGTLGLAGTNNAYADGTLGTVSIRDRRDGRDRGWSASVQSTDFVNQEDESLVIPASNVAYKASGVAGAHGTITNHMSDWTAIDTAKPAVSVRGVRLLDWTWTWVPNLRVTFPSGAEGAPAVAAGQYKGTVTTSVI